MLPEVALRGTVAVICVSVLTTKPAGTPLNCTARAPLNPAPVMITFWPTTPEAGANDRRAACRDDARDGKHAASATATAAPTIAYCRALNTTRSSYVYDFEPVKYLMLSFAQATKAGRLRPDEV